MNEGVEWAIHSCVNMTWAEDGRAVSAARLAEFYGLPTAYLNKQLQALVRAGILSSTSGPKGGFRLARAPERISVLDVVVAIEGEEPAFRCTQIVRDGPGGQAGVDYTKNCLVSQVMTKAEMVWRRELAGESIADIKGRVEAAYPDAPERARRRFAGEV